MENKENTVEKVDKVTETLIKELEGLSEEGLHEFFMFFYKMNHQHGNMIAVDKFEEFLKTFDHNPFKVNEDKKFRKQLIDNVVEFAYDHMSLLTAAMFGSGGNDHLEPNENNQFESKRNRQQPRLVY